MSFFYMVKNKKQDFRDIGFVKNLYQSTLLDVTILLDGY